MDGHFSKQVSICCPLVNHMFKSIVFALQPIGTLLSYAQEHPKLLPNDDAVASQEEQEMMEQPDQFNKTLPSTGCKYQYNPVSHEAALLQ